MDVWIGIIGAVMDLNSAENKELYLHVLDGQYLLTGCDSTDQTGHNNFELCNSRSSGFLVLVCVFEAIRLLVCPSLHILCTMRRLRRRSLPMCCAQKKCLFESRWPGVPAPRRMLLSWFLHSTLQHLLYPFKRQSNGRGTVCVHTELCCGQNTCIKFREK